MVFGLLDKIPKFDQFSSFRSILDLASDVSTIKLPRNHETEHGSSVPLGAGLRNVGDLGRSGSISNPDEQLDDIRRLQRNLLAEEKHESRRNSEASNYTGSLQMDAGSLNVGRNDEEHTIPDSSHVIENSSSGQLTIDATFQEDSRPIFENKDYIPNELPTEDSLTTTSLQLTADSIQSKRASAVDLQELSSLVNQFAKQGTSTESDVVMTSRKTIMTFGDMVHFENQVTGHYLHTLDDYMQLAVELAVKDAMKLQEISGAIVEVKRCRSSIPEPTQLSSNSDMTQDVACQCCLTEHVDLVDAVLPERASLGDISMYNRRFSLSYPPSGSVNLTKSLDGFVSNHARRVASMLELKSHHIGRLELHIMNTVRRHLQEVSTVNGVNKTDQMILYWMRSVSFLSTLSKVLLDAIADSVQTFHAHYHMSKDTVIYPEIASSVARTPHPKLYTAVTSQAEYHSVGLATRRGKTNPNKPSSDISNKRESAQAGRNGRFASTSTTVTGRDWGGQLELSAHRVLEQKKVAREAKITKKLQFLDELFKELTVAEQQLLLSMFAAVNGNGQKSYITDVELRFLLLSTIGRSFTLAQCRKFISEVDVDDDGRLCLFDVLSILYLTEAYLIAIAGGFLDTKISLLSLSFTSTHALLLTAFSEFCFLHRLRLDEHHNIFNKVTSCPSGYRGYVDEYQLSLESAPTLFCSALLGQRNSFFDIIASKLMGQTVVKLGALGGLWNPQATAGSVYRRDESGIQVDGLTCSPRSKYMVRKNSALAKPPIPPINVTGSKIGFDPHSVYENAGIHSFHRRNITQYGIEARSHSPANVVALSELKSMADRLLNIPQLFLESILFDSRKHREIVSVFRGHKLRIWTNENLPLMVPQRYKNTK